MQVVEIELVDTEVQSDSWSHLSKRDYVVLLGEAPQKKTLQQIFELIMMIIMMILLPTEERMQARKRGRVIKQPEEVLLYS